jgi:hypothetical protein
MAGLLEQLDQSVSEILAGWNVVSTLIAFTIVGFLAWIIYDSADADTHPLLLARQAVASYVRQPGESAVFRSPETPHGCMCTAPHHLFALIKTDMCQILFEPVLPSDLRARPCTPLAKMEIFGIFGDVSRAKSLLRGAPNPAERHTS